MPENVTLFKPSKTSHNHCHSCAIRNQSILNNLSLKELEILNRNKYNISYKAGETICKEGTRPFGLLCLQKGKIKVIRNGTKGTEQIVAFRKSGDFIGFRELMGEISYKASAIALEDSSVCVIDKKNFFRVIELNRPLAFRIIRFFVNEILETDNRLVDITQKKIQARLADALIIVNEYFGVNSYNGCLNVKLKRSDLAALANMTTANAIRILSAFSDQGLIDINRREIKIKNLKFLKRISIQDS